MERACPSHLLVSTALLLAACGPSSPPPAAPTKPAAPAAAAKAPEPEEKPAADLPTSCETKTEKWCLPPEAFVKRLCGGSFPSVALALFAKGTPWTRAYLRVKSVEAWNVSGGRQSTEKLVFEEELLVLAHRQAAPGGMSVSGAGNSVDVLRWDGTCASLMEEEISTRAPLAAKAARVPWKSLDDAIQNAMLSDEKLQKAWSDRKQECKSASAGDADPRCEKAAARLNGLVVDYVRKGGTIPPPERRP